MYVLNFALIAAGLLYLGWQFIQREVTKLEAEWIRQAAEETE